MGCFETVPVSVVRILSSETVSHHQHSVTECADVAKATLYSHKGLWADSVSQSVPFCCVTSKINHNKLWLNVYVGPKSPNRNGPNRNITKLYISFFKTIRNKKFAKVAW